MDANILKYVAFVKAVEYASFTRAAEVLCYSQSGISRMIHDLESEWGVTLLERSRSGVSLTSDGLALLPYARELCARYDELRSQVDALNGLKTGLVRVGTFSSAAAHWLPEVIAEFRREYPGIDYELLLGDYREIEGWVADGRVDIGFVRLPCAAGLEALPLARDEYMAVLPEGHPLLQSDTVPLAALCDEPFILLEHGERAEVREFFAQNALTPRAHITTWDDYAVMSMVERGLGVSMLPRLILQRAPYNIAVRPVREECCRTIGAVLRCSRTASVASRRFLEHTLRIIGQNG